LGFSMAADTRFREQALRSVDLLRSRRVIFEDGLSAKEVAACEARFGFRFPPDLRAFLENALPVSIESDDDGNTFPNWRSGDEGKLRERVNWPFEGMAFDIENNQFWLEDWGRRPSSLADAIAVARRHVDAAPKLIPVFSHRYVPDEPEMADNPVISVYQTDIIYYGNNLWDYFEEEFGPHPKGSYSGQLYAARTSEQYHPGHRHIRFWSDLVS
jgi:hypothetical protein